MKKIILLALFSFALTCYSIAQEDIRPHVAIQGGVGFPYGTDLSAPLKSGIFMAYISIPANYKYIWNVNFGVGYEHLGDLHALSEAMTASYRINIANRVLRIVPEAGLYLKMPILENTEYEYDEEEDSKVNLNFGLRVGGAIELFNNIHVGVNYDYSFTKKLELYTYWGNHIIECYLRLFFNRKE